MERSAAVIKLKRSASLGGDGRFYLDGKPIPLRQRYASWYLEVRVNKWMYLVPASCYAWYHWRNEWPTHAVRHRDGNKLNFTWDNLRLDYQATTPKVRMVGEITP